LTPRPGRDLHRDLTAFFTDLDTVPPAARLYECEYLLVRARKPVRPER